MRYSSALSLVREGKGADAAKVFGVIAQEGGGYATLAAFEEAELLAKAGDHKGVAAAYDPVPSTGGLDSVFPPSCTTPSGLPAAPSPQPASAIGRLAALT